MTPPLRVTVHLTPAERDFLTAFYERKVAAAREFDIAACGPAAARSIVPSRIVSLTDAGLLLEVALPSPETPHGE